MRLICPMVTKVTVIITIFMTLCTGSFSYSNPKPQPSRRHAVLTSLSTLLVNPNLSASAAESSITNKNGLAAKLSKRDPAALKNSVFNIPPSAQVYPPFMRGTWNVSLRFAGYIFPSQTIPKNTITSNFAIPGFQKCSIAAIADVGRDDTTYAMTISESTGLEDRTFNLENSINAHLGYAAVRDVSYDSSSNPNRISIDFVQNRTRNAERIELFCNAREAELVPNPKAPAASIFVCSEYIRQVTFSLSQEFGVARQVIGNYAHFWTWREGIVGTGTAGDGDALGATKDANTMTGNVLTAVYLDPQDPLFFQEPSKPVAVYSHQITATRST